MPAEPSYTTLSRRLDEDGRLLWITLDRPKGNVLGRVTLGELVVALERHRDDPRLKLIVLRGGGGQFSYGAAIDEHQPGQMRELLVALHTAARRLAAHPVPVAALIEGRALGGALELAICCHFIFAMHDARLGCPEIKLGVLPPLFAVAAPARFGGMLTERLMLTGEEIDATTADRAGWLTGRFPSGVPAEFSMREWFRAHLAPLSAFAIREATRAVRIRSPLAAALGSPLDDSERDYMERVARSHDGNEGITAFMEKRAPRWEDR